MHVQRWRTIAGAVVVVAAFMVLSPALAQDYPTRSVRIVVPFPPGGTADAMPRIIGDWLARKWGQAVVIENKAGAGGNVGAEVVANADPDGYTLLSSPPPPLVINQNLYPKLGFDPLAFVPISVMAIVPNALVVNPVKITADTVPQFITLARANPGKITSATQGNGTTSHLTSAMFQMLANVQFLNVPYRGSAPALQGLVAGDVDIMFDNLGVSLALVQGGKLKLIAVGTERRMTSLPEVPTIAETLPGFVSSAWFAVVAPPKTPQGIAAKINADIDEALRQPDIVKRLADLSAEPLGGTTAAAAAFMRQEVERWRAVIKATGIKLE
ncbi:MAG TPA: tripartite tricarboxylate transporter substrate binding protein [Xanthobacteraceae bacterium]|nr:tripartite tricarboxylate transporter substrate binding protein [Xanthobacteraceae bacterium]